MCYDASLKFTSMNKKMINKHEASTITTVSSLKIVHAIKFVNFEELLKNTDRHK